MNESLLDNNLFTPSKKSKRKTRPMSADKARNNKGHSLKNSLKMPIYQINRKMIYEEPNQHYSMSQNKSRNHKEANKTVWFEDQN